MSQPSPRPPHGAPRPPQVWDTSFHQHRTAPPGFGPAPQAFTQPAGSSGEGGDGGRRGPRRKALVIGLALLLVAGAGTGGWLLWGRDGHRPAPAKKPAARSVDAKLDWMAEVPDADKDSVTRMSRPWFVKNTVVLSTKKAVTAYDADSGKPGWTVEVPGTACKASPAASDGVAAVVYGEQEYLCDSLMVVDVEHGRVLWKKKLLNAKGLSGPHDLATLTVDRGLVTVADVGGDPLVYAAADGKQQTPKDYGCQERGTVVARARQLTVVECQLFGRQFVMNVDQKTGTEKWTWKVPDGLAVQNVISIEPAVLAMGRENDTSPTEIVSLDDKGRLKTLVAVSSGPYEVQDCYKNDWLTCRKVVVDGDTAYLATHNERVTDDGASPNAIVAVDLNTGKQRWNVPLGGTRGNRPLTMEDGKLLVYQQATRDESGKLLALDPADGSSSVYMKLPQESAERELALARFGSAYFHDGRFYLVTDQGMSDKAMMMAFR
ncbi:hypothetical protein BLA24_22970 [Streptomyces cinnamoneus]|uniref:Pyrrolo-quinoline quinone repeat domain-containing protein n=1 Tax=Streptomyces cinnamoneus TaxID=53446 RepID=A0A2G1XCM8_STRCJ|nr:PQQ-binding-like beta-propeller repeat protein [Streptomyces cinnamoneus]PHQ48970.1 hypothetical protein BLA24_22970 [Streptomyces cinnamoneus]PPT15385.1 hypothetical protein CYQ11_23105 [Streptomyces cinnamoneus]